MSRKKSDRKGQETHQGEIILYNTPDGAARVEVFFQDESFWLSQRRVTDTDLARVHNGSHIA
ncbi:MAG: hypothetical protein ACRENG_35235 [bacterium]